MAPGAGRVLAAAGLGDANAAPWSSAHMLAFLACLALHVDITSALIYSHTQPTADALPLAHPLHCRQLCSGSASGSCRQRT